ncbi:SCO2521 family protein [Parafrankia discariae]|uniref:SCO2521 family protein n=1 Tax=Parafrankia discariae TaxID=365528 RepID=UPI000371B677|nr:SCO2521 family protein [Parafrankia discariae]
MMAPRAAAVPRATAAPRAPKTPEPAEELDLLVGEVLTTLLQNSHRVGAATAATLLDIVPGGRVRSATRPMAHAFSPDVRVGVHCPLATASGTRADGAGTVVARASVTGGTVLQASSRARLIRAVGERRLPWSHYVANPGTVEVVGRSTEDDLAAGFLTAPTRASLDLGAVSGRLLGRVQRSPGIDRVASLRARRTKLRFAVSWRSFDSPLLPQSARSVEFVIHDETLRTLRLRLGRCDPSDAVAACEDLAFHDWLLSTVEALLDNSRIGVDSAPEVVRRFRPVIDRLLHLWMPGARVVEELAEVWGALERRPGFSREWASLTGQIRDQLMLAGLEPPSDRSARDRTAGADQGAARKTLSACDRD